MAVAVLNDWAGANRAGSPNGSLTISAGSDRLLWIVNMVETGTTNSFTSITVGTVAPTGSLVEESTNVPNSFLWSWYWDEAAIASMTGTTVAFSKSGTPGTVDWDYIVFSGASGGAEYATSTDETAVNSSITLTGTSTADDMIAVAINRNASARDVQGYDTLTEGWQYNVDYTIAVADGAGGDDTISLTGDGFSGAWLVQALHVKSSGGGGGGAGGTMLKQMLTTHTHGQ